MNGPDAPPVVIHGADRTCVALLTELRETARWPKDCARRLADLTISPSPTCSRGSTWAGRVPRHK
jgi:hypothetical protein